MRCLGFLNVATVAIVVIATGGCSRADGTKASSPEPAGRAAVGTGGAGANLSDSEFVKDVAAKNMAEIELSRMALSRATGADVKAFAQMMIDEHEAAGTKLKGVLSGRPIGWPAQLDEKYRKTADELAKQQGSDFDRRYMKAMVEGHQDLAAKLESRLDLQSVADWKTAAAGRTQNQALPDPRAALSDVQVRPAAADNDTAMKINRWAADVYPVAQKHLDTARTLEDAAKQRSTNEI